MLQETVMAELILGAIADGVFTVDETYAVTSFNTAAEQITGFSRTEVLGRPCHEVFRTRLCGNTCPLKESLKTGRPITNYEIDILRKSGNPLTISVSTSVLVDREGKFLGGVEVFRDVSAAREIARDLGERYTFMGMVSKSPLMRQIFDTLPNIAQSDMNVLIQGNVGTEADNVASAIHNLSLRQRHPFIRVDCREMKESLIEPELFGYMKGAFSGASKGRPGRLEAADRGTLFLQEIGEIPLAIQAKLVNFIQTREYSPMGSSRVRSTDIRIVASTSTDLSELVRDGLFRQDLYFRLNGMLIKLPALRERLEDIPLLIALYVDRLNQRTGKVMMGVSPEAMKLMTQYDYPGNIKELESILEHAYIVSQGERISENDLPAFLSVPSLAMGRDKRKRAEEPADILARRTLLAALRKHKWNLPKAAKELKVHRTTIWRQVKRFGLEQDS